MSLSELKLDHLTTNTRAPFWYNVRNFCNKYRHNSHRNYHHTPLYYSHPNYRQKFIIVIIITLIIINRPVVAGTVLQTPWSLSQSVSLFLQIFKIS